MRVLTTRRIIGVAAWLVAFHVLLAYGLPEGLFIALIIFLGIIYWRTGAMAAVTTSLTLIVITVFYGIALKLTGFEDKIYFRPDEKYASFDYVHNHRVYEGNVHIEMQMPHGDLRAMTREEIAEPRHVQFHTDSDGFRNRQDYHGQQYVLVGDSFIAGSSNSQEDMLTEQLLRDYQLDTYSLAYPGNPADYADYLRGFRQQHGDNFRALVFLFEGNDFDESRRRNGSWLARFGRRYYGMFSGFATYRVTNSLIKRFTRTRSIQAGDDLEIDELAGKKMAFYRLYMNVTLRKQTPPPEGFETAIESMRSNLQRIYFIPSKYRVYSGLVHPGEAIPNAQWQYLEGVCRKYQVHCVNLSEPLMQASANLLKKGEFTWWRDDTHWNRNGSAVAARVVAADIAADRNTSKVKLGLP